MAIETHEWRVSGMDCGACAGKVRRAVEHLPGISGVDVLLTAERLRLAVDTAETDPDRVEQAVRAIGYGIRPVDHDAPRNDSAPWHRSYKGRLLIGTGLLLALAWLFRLLGPEGSGHPAFVLATLIGVAPVALRAVAMLRTGQPFTIEMLMTIAATGALFIGAAEEAALVVFLFAVGETLEGIAAERARRGIRALSDLVPRTARRETDTGIREVSADRLAIGDIVVVTPGERVPADGEIVEGEAGLDESPVTGESIPVGKATGDRVLAGSIATDAALRVRVDSRPEDNTINRIVRLVEEAESARAPTERFIDRFSRIYMPAIVGTALLVALLPPLLAGAPWETWTYRALALLLIGCPCALVISVPAAIASALSAGTRIGLLIKGGAVIEALAATTHVALDKTGTLTRGAPEVTDIVPFGVEPAELLARAAAVEGRSGHPIALAITERAARDGLTLPTARNARALPGRGASADIDGTAHLVCSPRQAGRDGVMTDDAERHADRLEAEGKTVVAVCGGDHLLGLVALRDAPREDAATAMASLAALGVTPIMLTGDNRGTAAAISGELGIAYRAGLLPEDKVTEVTALARQGRVMMVGDGINDAPALAHAHVGVAMGSGTDVALETADAAILRNRVADIPALLGLGRATMANIHQNLAIALGLKAIFLVTTILGVTGLWLAILADTGATVLVTLNALRLLRFGRT